MVLSEARVGDDPSHVPGPAPGKKGGFGSATLPVTFIDLLPTHLNELRRELEWRTLEAEILGRTGEYVAVVDVYDVPLVVQENVAVVSILHLNHICHK